jgi:hypothetical protein
LHGMFLPHQTIGKMLQIILNTFTLLKITNAINQWRLPSFMNLQAFRASGGCSYLGWKCKSFWVIGSIKNTDKNVSHITNLGECRCLNLSTSMGGTRSKVEGGDRHDLEPEGTREDTRHEIYTGSGSRSSYPTSCLE